jgi:tetratricopeptide (TPR) repeat protein
MDRLYRPTLLLIVAAAAALAAREATLHQAAYTPETSLAPAGEADVVTYPPRLLRFPEGVVPVALNFAPPPLAPLDATGREIATSQAARLLNSSTGEMRRLPGVRAASLSPAAVEAIPPASPQSAKGPDAAFPPATDPWIEPQLPTPQPEAVGPELTLPQSESPAAERSIIKHEAPIGDSPMRPAGESNAARPSPHDSLSAVDSRARRTVEHALLLAERGAMYTARADLVQTLQLIAQALDAAQGTQIHTDSLAAAFRALEEGETFQARGSRPEAMPNVKVLVRGHRTPVLKDADLERLTALQAMQGYYTFAQEQFAVAAGRRPAASAALYGLGKLHMALPASPAGGPARDLPKAMVYHQAALLADPRNHLAANELGVLLARYEQWEEAKLVLLHGLSVHPLPQTWHNLAEVHQRRGETSLASQARFELEQLTRTNPGLSLPQRGPNVRWLTPAEFAATGEHPGPVVVGIGPQAANVQESRPGGIEWWKPWTWF